MALALRGLLKGHSGWVNSVATSPENPSMLLSASRDKTVIVWDLTRDGDSLNFGYPLRALRGHNHFVEDVVVSSDGQYALSASWDNTLRLWDLNTGTTSRRFVGHTNDVMSVAFSGDNRQIVSGSRDKTIKLWNTLGQCKFSIFNDPEDKGNAGSNPDAHTQWVSCVRFSPNAHNPLIVTSGWDKMIKVWNLNNCTLQRNLPGHTGYVNTVSVSPDGSLCASGGKDNTAMLWDLNEGKHLYSLEAGDEIHSLIFSPNRYWLCAATSSCIKIWDLESKSTVAELSKAYTGDFFGDDDADQSTSKDPACISLAWSADGSTLFSGYTDNTIRVWVA